MIRLWRHRWVRALVVGGAVAVVAAALSLAGALDALELKTLDTRFRLLARPERASRDVVLVAIDDGSLAYFQEQKVFWPWPRDFYAALNDHLTRGGARAIVYDILFPAPDIDRLNSDAAQTDGDFAEALAASKRTILATLLGDEAGAGRVIDRFGITLKATLHSPRFRGATVPIAPFQEGAARLGVVNYLTDPDDKFRRTPLVFQYGKLSLPALSLAALMHLENTDRVEAIDARMVRVGRTTIPLARDGSFLAYWYGRGGPRGVFKYAPFAAVLESARLEATGREVEAKYPARWFKDKLVVVGASAPGLFDMKATPMSSLEAYPGMEIHATLLSNLVNRDFLRDTPRWLTALLTALLSLLAAFLFFHASPSRAAVAVLTLLAAFLAAAAFAFTQADLWIEVTAPSAGLLGALLASAVVSYVTEGKSKRELRKIFSRYVSPAVVNELLENPEKVDLGGRTVEATVFFSDVADFTTISEQCQPAELVEYLNDYFSRATEHVLSRDAMLDKYIGDAIMAIFGAPAADPRHAPKACEAALAIQRETFVYGHGKHDPPLDFLTRIGINSGKMVVGNIGSTKRLDYTAIGDNVNLASRLEGTNKVYGTRIIVSESTATLIGSDFVLRELDFLTVKGKTRPIRIHELVGQRGEVSQKRLDWIARFHDNLALYRARKFTEALRGFEALYEESKDKASREYIARCLKYIEHPPPEDWDGVYALKTK